MVNFTRTLLSPGEFESQNPGRELRGGPRGIELGKRGSWWAKGKSKGKK